MSHASSGKKRKKDSKDWQKEYHRINAQYQSLLDNIGDAYSELDLSGTTTFINENAYRFLGYSKEESIGIHYKEYMSPETAEKVFKIYNTVYTTGMPAKSVEYDLIAKDGTTIFVQDTVILRRDDTGKPIGFASFSRDITEKKLAEMALRESEKKYRSILENIGDAYVEFDLAGTVTFLNDNATLILGYNQKEFIGMNYKEFSSPENSKKLFDIFYNVYKTGKPDTRAGYELITKDGSIKMIEAYVDLLDHPSGEIVGFKTVSRDVTHQKKAEIELIKSEKKYRNILENMLDSYTEVDLSGKTVFANKRAYEVMGYTKEEYLNMNYKNYSTPENADNIFAIYNSVYKTGKPATLVEYTLTAKDQTTRFVEANVNLIRDESGKPIGFTALSRDITEKKLAEKERKKLEAQLQQAQKMESIGTLAGGIAHDFNNLLMGILGLSSLMLTDTEASHPHHEYLTEIEKYVKNAVDLTRQLLGFARGGKYEVKPTNLNELLKKHNQMFKRTRKEITIIETYDKNLWTAEVDQSQIEQVLMNIYINAWQAMPEGGDLCIKTENVIFDKDVAFPFKIEPGKYVKISITDTGIGMDEAIQQRVFDPFFTTKEKERGTGLGLPSALGIIKNHGGFITLDSNPGKGSTFNIYLPASTKKMRKDIKSQEVVIPGSGTILIIDDEQMILHVGEKILQRLGYDVIIANNGNEGIDIYRKNREKVDMVILDMIMPGLSGSDTYEALKKINTDVKVLLASGYSLNGKAKAILDKGFSGFIQKPFTMEQISHKVIEILAK